MRNGTGMQDNTITLEAPSEEAMRNIGERLARIVRGGDVLLLSGPLGAGKTTLAQGFGAGLGIGEPIVSPTFTIARELDGVFPGGGHAHMIHVDAYRLGGSDYAPGQDGIDRLLDELESLGLDEELEDPGENTVVLMEWGSRWPPPLPRNVLRSISIARRNLCKTPMSRPAKVLESSLWCLSAVIGRNEQQLSQESDKIWA